MKRKTKNILPLGYKTNGLACGIISPPALSKSRHMQKNPNFIKSGKKSSRLDLGLVYSLTPARAAGVFTSNAVTSGSVKLCKRNLARSKYFQAIIVNSGNANCFTPDNSFENAKLVTEELARQLQIKKQGVLFASTGIIGKPLPRSRIVKSMPALIKGLSRSGLARLAEAILTTDTCRKLNTASLRVGKNKLVTICGIAKGAGMIAPKLGFKKATMLCFLLTDANITHRAGNLALRQAVDNSFNCITVDGCMSTNDTVILMNNACADNPIIKEQTEDFDKFCSALSHVCLNLAKMIVKDAEGATKFIQITVKTAKSFNEAKQVALSIANSNLFKTAMFGQSNNIGRIASAIGASGINIKEDKIRIKTSPLNRKNIFVEVGLNRGNAQSIVYTSDLSLEYVKINAD